MPGPRNPIEGIKNKYYTKGFDKNVREDAKLSLYHKKLMYRQRLPQDIVRSKYH